MNNSKMIIGVDIAKRVFQLHWLENETGKIVSLQFKRERFLEHFANRAPLSDWHGSLWRLTALGTATAGDGTSG